jgi:hypothetical protein
MKLRFQIDEAQSFKAGINIPRSVVSVDVDPSKLDENMRNHLVERLVGEEVHPLQWDQTEWAGLEQFRSDYARKIRCQGLLVAKAPTLESLLEAIDTEEKDLDSVAIE